MMIFANRTVAERITAAFPGSALLRRHPPPRLEAFAEVRAPPQLVGPPLHAMQTLWQGLQGLT